MPGPFQIFIAYARKDTAFLDELRVQLKPLERSNKVHIWYDGKIEPGQVWEAAIKENLHRADIILLLVSADAIASDYFYEKEMADALKRHHKGEARVVPFIIRPCAWRATPLAELQALPKNGKAVTLWDDRDHAYSDAVNALWKMVEKLDADRKAEMEKHERAERERKEQQRRKKEKEQQAELAKKKKEEQQRRQQQEQQRRQKLKQQQAKEAAERQRRQEQRRLAEAERKRQQQANKQQRQEKIAAGLRSPWAWGGVLALLLVFVLSKMDCSSPTVTTPPPGDNGDGALSFIKNRKSGFDFVKVPGGTYNMGSPENEEGRDDDECQHPVTVSSFEIGKYEVTQADWREVMGEDPPELEFKGCDQCPVERVSWDDVQVFIKKASAKYGQQFRLPTEEEWEYAARGGSKSKGYLYAGSNDLDEVGWYWKNSGDKKLSGDWDWDKLESNNCKTHPVGSKKANELGIYDMSGNVWEWCADEWKPYPDCEGEKNSGLRAFRGGSWYFFNRYCRCAGRGRYYRDRRSSRVGFRLAR